MAEIKRYVPPQQKPVQRFYDVVSKMKIGDAFDIEPTDLKGRSDFYNSIYALRSELYRKGKPHNRIFQSRKDKTTEIITFHRIK